MSVPVPEPPSASRFRELRGERIVETVERLAQRIDERFPGSGLSGLCHHLHAVAAAAADDVPRLGRPIWPLRFFVVAAIVGLVAAVGWVSYSLLLKVSPDPGNISDALQG